MIEFIGGVTLTKIFHIIYFSFSSWSQRHLKQIFSRGTWKSAWSQNRGSSHIYQVKKTFKIIYTLSLMKNSKWRRTFLLQRCITNVCATVFNLMSLRTENVQYNLKFFWGGWYFLCFCLFCFWVAPVRHTWFKLPSTAVLICVNYPQFIFVWSSALSDVLPFCFSVGFEMLRVMI